MPPRLSIIVPVRRVRGTLRECLRSVLSQSFRDIEVIGVADGSPDGSDRLLDEIADGDPRLRAVHLPEPAGAETRRTAGAERATGDYLLFLEGAHVLLPGALERIAERLESAKDPDVLLFGHLRTPFRGVPQPTRSLQLLHETGASQVCTLAEHPELLGVAAVCWNRAVRRDVHRAQRIGFASGPEGDRMYALATLVTAESVAVLPTPCVEHRVQRHLPALAEPEEAETSPADLIEQFEELFTALRDTPRFAKVHGALFDVAARELLEAYPRATRRRRYGRAVAAFCRVHRPNGHQERRGFATLRLRLLCGGRGALLAGLDAAFAARRGLLTLTAAARARAVRRLTPLYYRLQRLRPLDQRLAVYTAYWNRGVSCNPAAVHRKAAELAPHIRGVWIVSAKAAAAGLPPGVDHVVPGTLRYWSVLARGTYFISNVNFHNHLVKRRGQIHVMTHHGTPLKVMGMGQQEYPAAAQGMNFRGLLHRVDRWDLSLSSNPHSTEVWSRAYPGAVRHLESGYPRNDVLVNAGPDEVEAARERLGLARGQRAVLYAPTFRDYERTFSCRLDLDRVVRELGERGEDTVFLVRAHYFHDGSELDGRFGLDGRSGLIDISGHPRVEELFLAADALITDYSSLMFDYALLDRPIIIHAPDWEIYRAVRGVTFDLLSGLPGDTPGEVTRTTEDVVRAFTDGSWDGERSRTLRAAFRERFCAFDDGRAAERVVRHVLLGEETVLPVAPPAGRGAAGPLAAVPHQQTAAAEEPAEPRVVGSVPPPR
ncbi:bifunctional glycosyltransferase family 2 protein/CDP-glycerol:glycerophosphate glycerophosphotransferase [Streptomyces sp. HNM0663]|uniref:Bifunctional glycosyltransferase family 2 protein/CDP-glycerol:glycerophosphate glycerophosphotransferase n=1 Tax=Streptomyces chengmaiensis TaxID=3040919 RepID=A0ABT6HX80_9ACTN|nr:bifunctional glycosyltransferase family 2 protein/CDP-glycerol:glycerophosphate glycerophosphotransferase [Streptomyces chengmaiensis]MDH2392942.1 bifunctional glycosyltransferase family 2 protein/CDP-glycerol:glycerophosphate glycerophosphotransferase [Streptomyces chengmaiensis]